MMSKELKNLSRRELVDIIYQLKKNEQDMQAEIALLKEELQTQHIRIEAAGSIADAAVSITDLFATAQKTADLYIREIEDLKARTEQECAQKIQQTEKKVKEILVAGEQQFSALAGLHQTSFVQQQEKPSQMVDNLILPSMPKLKEETVEDDYVMQLPILPPTPEITEEACIIPEREPTPDTTEEVSCIPEEKVDNQKSEADKMREWLEFMYGK